MDIFTPHYEKVTIFAFAGNQGNWRISKGRPSERLANAVFFACADEGITEGWIAYKEDYGRRWVDFSPSFPTPAQRRIETIVVGMVL